jgi:hypothetical protein
MAAQAAESQEEKEEEIPKETQEITMAPYRRGKTYHADFTLNGQRYRQSLRTTDWREAQAREKQLIAQAIEGKLAPTSQGFSRLPFSEAADRYLEGRGIEVSQITWQTERDRMKPLLDFFAGFRMHQITVDSVRSYLRLR